MKTIIIKTQAELDALPNAFPEATVVRIEGGTPESRISVRAAWGSAHVVAWGSAHVVAWDSAHVEAWDSAHVEAWDSAHVVARDSAHVVASGSAHVVARDSAHVVARGSAHVEARDSVCVRVQSAAAVVELLGFAVAILLAKIKVVVRSETATVIEPRPVTGNAGWLESQGVTPNGGSVTLFKRVSADFQTQEATRNETNWPVGETVEHENWNPTMEECGEGKFHACSRPYFCDEFRSEPGDRYIAIKIDVADLHAWKRPNYPHKIAFRRGMVLFECDRYGNKIEGKGAAK